MNKRRYLYRGTTRGWPGNGVLQEERTTCCSTDPLVACLFALECRTKGEAIVYATERDRYSDRIAPENYGSLIESAINVLVSPSEFIAASDQVLDVETVLIILNGLGFEGLPVQIWGKDALRTWLLESYNRGDRLNVEQLDSFDQEMEVLR